MVKSALTQKIIIVVLLASLLTACGILASSGGSAAEAQIASGVTEMDGMARVSSAAGAIDNSDCVLIVTEWEEFRDENLYKGKTVIDGRRTLDPQKAREVCDYHGACW